MQSCAFCGLFLVPFWCLTEDAMLEESSSISGLMHLYSCLFNVSALAARQSQLAFICLVLMSIGIAASVHHRVEAFTEGFLV